MEFEKNMIAAVQAVTNSEFLEIAAKASFETPSKPRASVLSNYDCENNCGD